MHSPFLILSVGTILSGFTSAQNPISIDGTCGVIVGFTCQGSRFGACCGADGFCGLGASCGVGCQPDAGLCAVLPSSSLPIEASSMPVISTPVSSTPIETSSTLVISSTGNPLPVISLSIDASSTPVSSTPGNSSPIVVSSTPASSLLVSTSTTDVSSTQVSSSPTDASSTTAILSSDSISSSSSLISSTSYTSSSSPIHASSTQVISSSYSTSSSVMLSSASHASSSSVDHFATAVASSFVAVSSSVHNSISSYVSPEAQSAASATSNIYQSLLAGHVSLSSEVHGSVSTHAASASSGAYSASSITYRDSNPPALTSAAVHASSSSGTSLASFSSVALAHQNDYSSVPASNPSPIYSGPVSGHVYGDNAPASTPYTTSSPMSTSSNLIHPVLANSAYNFGDHPSYPVGSPVKKNYPPTPSKVTLTTTYTRTYTKTCIDAFETVYTTKITTFAVTYCPTITPAEPTPGKPKMPSKPNDLPSNGWDRTTKNCNKGCGEAGRIIPLTVPCTQCNHAEKPICRPIIPPEPVCNGDSCGKDASRTTAKVYETKIVTLTKIPVPNTHKSAHSENSKFSFFTSFAPLQRGKEPASKPALEHPESLPKSEYSDIVSVGVGVYASPSKAGFRAPVFTGAAKGLRCRSFVVVIGTIVAAMIM